jgi:CBS domain-containing membrane protein
LGTPLLAGALAVALAIGTMSLARCLHPPGGACALLYALGAAGTPAWGWMHLLAIVLNVTALAAAGWLYNNLTGHSWPHRPLALPNPVPGSRTAQVHTALTEVMAEWNEVIDADIDDLDAIFQAVERRIRSRAADAPPMV